VSAGDPDTTEHMRIILLRRRKRARAVTRAYCMIAAQTASNTIPIAAMAEVWFIRFYSTGRPACIAVPDVPDGFRYF
jgi:hypothetical protein